MSAHSHFGGDFYCQDDDVHRGTVLGAPGIDGFLGASAFEDAFGGVAKEESAFGVQVQTSRLSSDCSLTRFDEAIAAPAAPSDPLFRFEVTTAFVKIGPSAADLGNSLLALFASEATASVTKVTPKKCSMKVLIECQGFFCEAKVRIYAHPQGHAVELQRRAGDVFVFTAIYNRVSNHLQALACLPASGLVSMREPHCEPTELVLLPLLTLREESQRFSVFPREAPTDHSILPAEASGSTATHGNSFWGPLALPQLVLAV